MDTKEQLMDIKLQLDKTEERFSPILSNDLNWIKLCLTGYSHTNMKSLVNGNFRHVS